MSTWWGNDFDNYHNGPENNQYGLGGDDTLISTDRDRSYTFYGGNGADELVGYKKGDHLYGGDGDDNLYGYNGGDYLEGGSGSDYLGGFNGNDTLSGGGGNDAFFFETKLNSKTNFDKILDFDFGNDRMRLDNDIFHGVGKAGHTLPAGKFEVGSDATSSKTRILYDENKGVVYYTPDGVGGKQTKFVKVTEGMDLDHSDFFVIA